jgi:subtilisin family serine protease
MNLRSSLWFVLLVWSGGVQDVTPEMMAPVTIAVVDDGVDMSHPGLTGRVASNHNFLSADGAANPRARSGDLSHGTMVALVALEAATARHASRASDGKRPTDPITVLALRVADERGVDGEAAARAVSYAGSRRGRVIVNLSMGTIRSTLPQSLVAAITAQREVLFVVAAGNQGKRISEMRASLCRIPADNLVCVAAVDTSGHLAAAPKASNFGRFVDLAALGVDVGVRGSTGVVHLETGSSVAAAMTSGVAADIWSAAPDLTARDVARALCAGARRGALGDTVECGVADATQSIRWARAFFDARVPSSTSDATQSSPKEVRP